MSIDNRIESAKGSCSGQPPDPRTSRAAGNRAPVAENGVRHARSSSAALRRYWHNGARLPGEHKDYAMMDHGAQAAPAPRGLAEFAREAGAGISAAFVLVAMMLPLGLIAFAPLGEYAVEAGLRAAFAAAIFGNLTAIVLSGALASERSAACVLGIPVRRVRPAHRRRPAAARLAVAGRGGDPVPGGAVPRADGDHPDRCSACCASAISPASCRTRSSPG